MIGRGGGVAILLDRSNLRSSKRRFERSSKRAGARSDGLVWRDRPRPLAQRVHRAKIMPSRSVSRSRAGGGVAAATRWRCVLAQLCAETSHPAGTICVFVNVGAGVGVGVGVGWWVGGWVGGWVTGCVRAYIRGFVVVVCKW